MNPNDLVIPIEGGPFAALSDLPESAVAMVRLLNEDVDAMLERQKPAYDGMGLDINAPPRSIHSGLLYTSASEFLVRAASPKQTPGKAGATAGQSLATVLGATKQQAEYMATVGAFGISTHDAACGISTLFAGLLSASRSLYLEGTGILAANPHAGRIIVPKDHARATFYTLLLDPSIEVPRICGLDRGLLFCAIAQAHTGWTDDFFRFLAVTRGEDTLVQQVHQTIEVTLAFPRGVDGSETVH